MAAPIIRTNNVAVVYGEGSASLRALDGVNIEIFPEEYIIFFGPSGCGKSTLLYTIAGLEKTTEGSVVVLGNEIAKLGREEMVDFHRNTIGMIFQAYYLITSLSVLQNVALPQIFASKNPEEREDRANKLLKRFGILEQAEKLPTSLSGGQQQRVAIARSLANNAPILLADEPVGNLDSKSADIVLELLKDLNKTDKKTVIMVTHNPNHLHYADRVFYMKDGKVIREVRNEPEKDKPAIKVDEQVPLMNFGLQEYAKLFPHLSEEELKAKMLTSYVLGEIDIVTEEKLETLVGQYVRHQINDDQFIRKVTRPVKNDGLGLYHAFAERLLHSLKDVLGMAEYVVNAYGNYPKTYEAYDAILTRLADYLYTVTEHKPTPEDIDRVKKVLKSRLEGSIDHIGFQEFLDKPTKVGGAGLNIRTARNFARHFELILLGFDERVRRNKESAENGKPHLFGMKPTVMKPESPPVGAAAQSQTPMPRKPEQKNSVTPLNAAPPTITPAQPKAQTTIPLSQLHVRPNTPKVAVHQTTPLVQNRTAQPSTSIANETQLPPQAPLQASVPNTQPPHAKTIEESIQFFPTPAQNTSKTLPTETPGFLSKLTHALHREETQSSQPMPIPTPPHNARPQLSVTGQVIPTTERSATITPFAQPMPPKGTAPSTQESVKRAPFVPQPTPTTPPASHVNNDNATPSHTPTPTPPKPPQFVATKPTPYNAPMIFPQKLTSFTQEKHENR